MAGLLAGRLPAARRRCEFVRLSAGASRIRTICPASRKPIATCGRADTRCGNRWFDFKLSLPDHHGGEWLRLNIVATWDRFRLCCFSSGGRNRAPHSAAGREVTRSRDVNDRTCTGSILSRLSGSGDGRCALSATGYRNWHRAGSAWSCSASCTRLPQSCGKPGHYTRALG